MRSRDLPEPEVNWKLFATAISALNDRLPLVWNPIKKKSDKWINMKALNKAYDKKGECVIA